MDFLVIQGDWNSKIGTEAYNYWGGTAGQFEIGETNYRGIRLLDFASKRKITIANTLFPYKVSRRTPWHSPNGRTHKQIGLWGDCDSGDRAGCPISEGLVVKVPLHLCLIVHRHWNFAHISLYEYKWMLGGGRRSCFAADMLPRFYQSAPGQRTTTSEWLWCKWILGKIIKCEALWVI